MFLPDGAISDWCGNWIAAKRNILVLHAACRDCFLFGLGRADNGDLSALGSKSHKFAVYQR